MSSWVVTNTLALLLLPPGCLLLLAAYGLAIAKRRPRAGRAVVGAALLMLYLVSTEYVADRLLRSLEPQARDPLADGRGQAIVVLGGGQYFAAPEYAGADTVTAQTLVRLRYAAQLHRASGKPVLVTGGSPAGAATSEAGAMKAVLEREFSVPVRWTEGESRTTLENARLSRRTLSAAGIDTVYLVTHGWHMARARRAFEHEGFRVIPAPTAYTTGYRLTALDFMPSARALHNSSRFAHEIIGGAWYRLKFLVARRG